MQANKQPACTSNRVHNSNLADYVAVIEAGQEETAISRITTATAPQPQPQHGHLL